MIDGILAGMALIGVILIIFIIIMRVFKTSENTVFLILIKDSMPKNEICNIIYGLYFKSIFCGDCVYENVLLLDLLSDKKKKEYLSELVKEIHTVKIISAEDFEKNFL